MGSEAAQPHVSPHVVWLRFLMHIDHAAYDKQNSRGVTGLDNEMVWRMAVPRSLKVSTNVQKQSDSVARTAPFLSQAAELRETKVPRV